MIPGNLAIAELRCVAPAPSPLPAYAALRELSSDQLAATMRLLLWMGNTNPTPAQVRAKALRTFRGDKRFAELVVMALQATTPARAAND